MTVIAYNYDGYVIDIVNAKSKELAEAYWQGKNVIPHEVKTYKDFTPLSDHPTGVIPILSTIEVIAGSCKHDAKLLTVTKRR